MRWRAARPSRPRSSGAALTADAFHISAPEPTGRGACMAMTKAMRDAGVAPDEIDYIAAHGTSTSLNDVTETRAIKAAIGEHAHRVAISSTKSMVGHLSERRASSTRFAAIGAIREGVVAADDQPREPGPARVATSTTCRSWRAKAKVDTAMINGFGFGGQNAVAVFRRFAA